MLIENLSIGRVAMHEVLKRDEDRTPKEPIFGNGIERLPDGPAAAFRLRVTESLSAQSKSIEMRLIALGDDSLVAIAEKLVSADDTAFHELSKDVARNLAAAQKGRGIPGGIVIVFEGSFGVPERRFVGVIKAETQSGFRRQKDREQIITQFLDDIFLTPAQRLYKIGFLVEGDPENGRAGWTVVVFDSNITSSHRESAAQYFYEGFLGSTFPSNGAYETQRFYDLTRDFVRKADLEPESKRDLADALYTFVKTDKAATFTAQEFASNYLPAPLRDAFGKHLKINKFPDRAIIRDTSDMGTRLKKRRFRFGSDIEFSAPPEALHSKKVDIRAVNASDLGGDGSERWTQIIIKREMTDQL